MAAMEIGTKVRVVGYSTHQEYIGKIGEVCCHVTIRGIDAYKVRCGQEILEDWATEDCFEIMEDK